MVSLTRHMKCFWMLTSTILSQGGQMPWIQKIQQVIKSDVIINVLEVIGMIFCKTYIVQM